MIGEKIKTKRKELGYSLKTLASLTELTPGFLSQIERDVSEPSITSLRKIADALEVAVFYFFIDAPKSNPVVRKNDRQKIVLPHSQMSYELLSPDLNRQMEMFMGQLEPGAKTCEEPLGQEGEEVIHVLKGKMWILIGEKEYDLEAGDTIYYDGYIPHQIINTGDRELVFISTITPPLF